MRRAKESCYDSLILTVDTAVGGIRWREVRNGLTIPPQLTLRTILDMSRHPQWWSNVLTTEPLTFASLSNSGGTVGDLLTRVFDPGITPEDIKWIRDNWDGAVMVKGVQALEDAQILPGVVDAVRDRTQVYIDGGIMSGTDIVAALAFGATGTLVGRAYLYGLMAGGQDGVQRVVDILSKEIKTTLQLMGVTSIDQLDRSMVRLRPY